MEKPTQRHDPIFYTFYEHLKLAQKEGASDRLGSIIDSLQTERKDLASQLKGKRDFIIDKEEIGSKISSILKQSAESQSPIETVQKERSNFMKESGIFITEDREDIVLYSPLSSSGLKRLDAHTNTYLSFHQDTQGKWSVEVGAAQGTSQDKKLTKKEREERYVEEFYHQIALGMVGLQMASLLNGENKPLVIPSPIVLSNYLSDGVGVEADGAMIAQRRRALKDIFENGLDISKLNNALGRLEVPSLNLEAEHSHDLIWNQSGVNLVRHHVRSRSKRVNFRLKTPTTSASSTAAGETDSLIANESKIALIEAAIAAAEQPLLHGLNNVLSNPLSLRTLSLPVETLFALYSGVLGFIRSGLDTVLLKVLPKNIANILGQFIGLVHAIADVPRWPYFFAQAGAKLDIGVSLFDLTNQSAHIEALKSVLIAQDQKEGGNALCISGCKSAKDRKGYIRLLSMTYQDYLSKYGEAPPMIGSAEYHALEKDKKDFLQKRFWHHYEAASIQFVGHANSPHASGLRHIYWLMGTEERRIIVNKVKELNEPAKSFEKSSREAANDPEYPVRVNAKQPAPPIIQAPPHIQHLLPANSNELASTNKQIKTIAEANRSRSQ